MQHFWLQTFITTMWTPTLYRLKIPPWSTILILVAYLTPFGSFSLMLTTLYSRCCYRKGKYLPRSHNRSAEPRFKCRETWLWSLALGTASTYYDQHNFIKQLTNGIDYKNEAYNKYKHNWTHKMLKNQRGKKSSRSLLLTVIFPLAWRSTDTGLRCHRHESLANCFFPALCYIKSHSSGSKNRIVRAVPIVLTNKVYHSISDDFKTVWVAPLWNACEILWWRYTENFWKWNFLKKRTKR